MDKKFIPVAEPVFDGNERKYLNDCLDSTWISSNGKYVQAFEKQYADFCGVKYAIACMNGTVAIHLPLVAMGFGTGDEIIVPTFTFVATANCVAYTGATPVFVDCDPNTWNITAEQILKAITPRTKAIIVVDIYGLPVDLDPILQVARERGLFVLEDAAEAHGARYRNQMVGSLGDIGSFSFYGNKIITTGEGGMVTTNNEELASKVRQLRDQGVDGERRYWFPVRGYNYRMTSLQAAIGVAQLERIQSHLSQRRRVNEAYRHRLEGFPQLAFQPEMEGFENSYWMTSVVIDETLPERDWVISQMAKFGIETRPFFHPMHTLPMYENLNTEGSFPVATRIGNRGINLPSSGNLSEGDIDFVCDKLIESLALKA